MNFYFILKTMQTLLEETSKFEVLGEKE